MPIRGQNKSGPEQPGSRRVARRQLLLSLESQPLIRKFFCCLAQVTPAAAVALVPLPSLPLPPLVRSKCCIGDRQRPSLEKLCPILSLQDGPRRQAPGPSPSKLLGARQLRAASEGSCQPSGSVPSARSSALAPRSRQHDRSEQEFARTGARAQQTRAGPSGGGCRCPVHGADRGSGLPARPWMGTV